MKECLWVLFALSLVSGCVSDSGTAPLEMGAPQAQTIAPELFSEASGAQSVIGDALFVVRGGSRMLLSNASGTVGPAGTRSVFEGPLTRVRDPDGANAREELFDGSVRVRTDGDEYRFTRFFVTESDTGASVGVFGLPSTQALPTSGAARYIGTGTISEVGGVGSLPVDQLATSRVDVDFATSRVDVSLDVPERARSLLSDVDRLVARGLFLQDSTFAGNAVRAFKNGGRVTPTGANSESVAAGRFYGPSEIGAPAEVGGVMHISGDNGIVLGLFIAD